MGEATLPARPLARSCQDGPSSFTGIKMLGLMRCLFLLVMLAAGTWSEGFAQERPVAHPDVSAPGWVDLFEPDLSNALYPEGVWRFRDGVLTASEDEIIWSAQPFDRFILDLEFKTAPGTNSGVFVYGSDIDNWVANSVEIQIADDFAEQWSNAPASWRSGAIFGRLPASKSMVRQPGEWNGICKTQPCSP